VQGKRTKALWNQALGSKQEGTNFLLSWE